VPLHAYLRATVYLGGFGAVLGALLWEVTSGAGAVRLWGLLVLGWLGVGLLLAHLFYERLDLGGRTVTRLERGRRRLALTFDDGPNEPHTSALLAVLARHQVRATFFLVGEHVRRQPETVRRIVEAGHAIGNHGLTHSILTFKPRAVVEQEIGETQRLLAASGAASVSLFRAPHGFKSVHLGPLLDRYRLTLCAWSIGVWDTDNPGAEVIATRVLDQIKDGAIVLLHDGEPGTDRADTVAAVDRIITACLERGFRFVTLPEGFGEHA
jgi:peptidoglycan/xylan/chitin deacetylase (PgdA/CDA1 family)